MASKPYDIYWTEVEVGMQIAVDNRGRGFAWNVIDVERRPGKYDWRIVIGKDRAGPIIDRGGPGINGPLVVVRDLGRGDRTAIVTLVQHIRNAVIARDRESEQQLRRQLERRIAALR
ncbi:hypothetical protein JQS43_24330 [Natronosporangium hydrolyticum]|uniref:Uncharacterized protein n=1 Tax=Natronosporangium hydrolyticum TaxID=2811111 RepID=A0A895YGN8_9ACTN|nr:hypothetical protein [Natronosporangium hydrolyticum]QSB14563.1 hypothetical protein JQS43_24330 [Natronosporangium hydrolyticum]